MSASEPVQMQKVSKFAVRRSHIGDGRTDSDAAFSRVNIEYLGSVCARDGDISARVHFAGVNALLPNHRHSVFDPVDAVWYLPEVVLAEGLLVRVEHAVVRACTVQVAT